MRLCYRELCLQCCSLIAVFPALQCVAWQPPSKRRTNYQRGDFHHEEGAPTLLFLMVASEHSASEESQSESPNCSGFWKKHKQMFGVLFYFMKSDFFFLFLCSDVTLVWLNTTDLIAVFIRAQFPQGDLGFHPAYGALFVWKPIWLRGDVYRDIWCMRQQLIQVLLLTGAQSLKGPTVGVVARVPFLSVRRRKVLWAEGGARLEAAHAAVRSMEEKKGKTDCLI